MGKIYYIMGKSASGKDTIYKELQRRHPNLKNVIMYTTRPIREGEVHGVDYHFVTGEALEKLRQQGKIIEERTYETIHGPWTYFTADDGQINKNGNDSYLLIGTLKSYEAMLLYFGRDFLVPIYIEVEDGIRLQRALNREIEQKEPKFKELCRRFLADAEDFKEENLTALGIDKKYNNESINSCLKEIEDQLLPALISCDDSCCMI